MLFECSRRLPGMRSPSLRAVLDAPVHYIILCYTILCDNIILCYRPPSRRRPGRRSPSFSGPEMGKLKFGKLKWVTKKTSTFRARTPLNSPKASAFRQLFVLPVFAYPFRSPLDGGRRGEVHPSERCLSLVLSAVLWKGTNGVSTNGVTANFMLFDRGTFWVLPLIYFYIPKSAMAYLFPQSVKNPYFCSGPINADPIGSQPHHVQVECNRPVKYTQSDEKSTTSREIEPVRRSFCRRRSCTFTANLHTKILDFGGLDSSRILNSRGGILVSIGNFPESLSQAVLVRIILVGRLGVRKWHVWCRLKLGIRSKRTINS